jgi:hypothetical protein
MAKELITFDEFKEILGNEVLEKYSDCVIKGFNDQLELIKFNSTLDCFVELDLTTKAKFAHNRICGRLAETFKDHPYVKVDTIRKIITVNISDKVLVRQKKFTQRGRISSASTNQHITYMNQGILPGFPEQATYVVGGYMLNRTSTEMQGVYFGCYSASGVEWFTKLGEYVHEQQRLDFTVTPLEKKLVSVKKKLTKLKIVSFNERANKTNDKSK